MKKLLLAVSLVCFVLTAGAFADEFSADVNSVAVGMTTMSKIYYKDFDTSRTEAMGMVIIMDGEKSYQLFEDTKKYVAMDMEEMKQQNPMADVDDFEEFITENDIKKTGSEKMSGYKCDVYEGNITYDVNQPPLAMKLWYSAKLDYPVRTETQLPGGMGTAVSTLENIKTGKQPASLFEIPAGYTEARSMEEAMGMSMGGFSMPFGGGDAEEDGGTDEMPSQDEMNQMMQMMQEMMGGQN
jgi:outer membrane lipoprotein-sorting protein